MPPRLQSLQPKVSATRLRPVFEQHGRMHIPGILPAAEADAVAGALRHTPWARSTLVNGKPYDLPPEALAAMPPERMQQLDAAVAAAAREGFQYQFDGWRLSDLVDQGAAIPPGLEPLVDLYRLLNGPDFLAFVAELTGETREIYCDAQATRYRAGDFLTVHDDGVEGKNRLLAYVLSFTTAWRPDWGGLLVFHDQDGHVAEGYTPTFNSLNIFRVPQPHAVTQVATFVTAERLSVTGWIRHR